MGGNTRTFHFSNANDVFRQFFGTSDPFAAGFEDGNGHGVGGGFPGAFNMADMTGGFSMGGGGVDGGGRRHGHQKGKDTLHTLNVTLKEVYNGATKRVRITKKILDASGRTVPVYSHLFFLLLPLLLTLFLFFFEPSFLYIYSKYSSRF